MKAKEPRVWNPAICHQQAHSNTGIPGISEGKIGDRSCFRVSLRPARNVRQITTVYYGRKGVTREDALERAKALRFETVAKRVKEEGRIVP